MDEFSYVPASSKIYIASKTSYVLKFDEVFTRKQSMMDAKFDDDDHALQNYHSSDHHA